MELGGFSIGVREGVLGLIALVALYIIVVLARMILLRRQPNTPAAPEVPSPTPVTPERLAPVVTPELVADDDTPVLAVPVEPPDEIETPIPPALANAWEAAAASVADENVRQTLAQEVVQLRDEVDAIRGELAALREDMQHELAHLRAAQSMSPIYGDAMQLAVAGYDPALIAERCGIARAEAELVVALAKSQAQ
ncbi:DUF2802 domain-containing protein [Dechloromonas sp.]|uniref:DUF2802 domain-containing protein n=1 Tax=Dechloromonas sp. TaxID=1917218 RepID=UPI0012253802|nr:DUF2802 domain-containing protein [Dechloromonas sp.]MBU3698052.1 DUF2802 domain-containing protein [Dechloromonas sp.]TEX44262.1 MAG: hypothetical protein CFR70_14485 [Rhodocyclaceae bacterium]